MVRRLLRVGVIGALVSSGLVFGGPVQGGDLFGPYMDGAISGAAGCSSGEPLGPDDCREFKEVLEDGDSDRWNVDREVSLAISGGAMSAAGKVEAAEFDNADGTLGSLTLAATLEATLTSAGGSSAQLELTADFPISGESITVIGQLRVEGTGTALIGGAGDISVTVGCAEEPAIDVRIQVLGGAHGGEEGRPNADNKSDSIEETVQADANSNGSRFCSLRVLMDAVAGTNQRNDRPEHGFGKAKLSLTILAGGPAPTASAGPGDCALAGIVLDGDATIDGHSNPLAGIRVELLRNSGVIGSPVATEQDGRYCFPWDIVPQTAPGSPEPGSYEIRATLIDAAHEPPVFHTEHESDQRPITSTWDVAEAEWGMSTVDVAFSSDDQPWLSDVANIHWQSSRFVDWILDVLLIPPADLAGFKVRAFSSLKTQYTGDDRTAHISVAGSAFAARRTALSNAPENGEWHEIIHHLAPILGIAPETAGACQGYVNHGGWTNASTCDSLSEAFAMFVPVVASLELDAGRAGGYATPHYAGFGSSEDNRWAPWDFVCCVDNKDVYREDLGVLQLLWDLQDDTPGETRPIAALPRTGGPEVSLMLRDRVALGGTTLIQMLAIAKPETVADIHDFLTTSPLVDAVLRTPDVDIDGDGSADISAIDEAFLMHRFRPLGAGPYKVGGQVAHTPPGDRNQTDRRHIDHVAGSVLRLANTGTGMATFTLAITSESGTSTFAVPVAPGSTLDLELELGPYWTEPRAAGAGLPSCGAESEVLSTLAISGPGGVSQSLDSCDYAHRVVAAVDGVALTVSAAGTEPVQSAAPGPVTAAPSPGGETIILIVGLLVVGLVVAGGLVVFARRRS